VTSSTLSPPRPTAAGRTGSPRATAGFDALVLNAHQRQALVAVRSLGRRGLRVAAVDTVDKAPAFSSRWCHRGFVFPVADGTDSYLALLEEVLPFSTACVVIPSHDGTIALLRRHRARLEPVARLALAAEGALEIAVSKERTLAMAVRLGLRVPRGIPVHGAGDVPMALKEVGLPAVIKPNESWLWQGSHGAWAGPRLVTNAVEAEHAVVELTRFGGAALWQQLLTGRREAVSFLYANGQVHARFAQWATRTRPPLGGASVVRQSIAVPDDIGRDAEALVRAIGLEGYAEVEFRRDSGGVPYLMEINPRLSASVELAVRAGVDFPYLLYQWAMGGPIDLTTGYRVGGWMRHLGGDIMTTLETLGERGRPGVTPPGRALLDFGRAFLRPMGYDYADAGDPLPALTATANFTRQGIASVISRVKRSFS
jgi:predicted ATP-grasp superfamily ATP-dependent carboligase